MKYETARIPISTWNFYGSRDGTDIDTIVFHTIVGSIVSATARFQNPQSQVSAHYGVGYDGHRVQWVDEAHTAYANGVWSWNQRAITIEHEDFGDYDGPRPDELYESSAELVRDIARRHSITRLVVGVTCRRHREISATRCPDALDVERIVATAGGGDLMSDFDPRSDAASLKFLDARIREIIVGEPQLVANVIVQIAGPLARGALRRVPTAKKLDRRQPATHMKGTPPKGHPARRKVPKGAA